MRCNCSKTTNLFIYWDNKTNCMLFVNFISHHCTVYLDIPKKEISHHSCFVCKVDSNLVYKYTIRSYERRRICISDSTSIFLVCVTICLSDSMLYCLCTVCTVCLSVCLSVSLSLSVCFPLCVSLSLCLSALSLCLSLCTSVCQPPLCSVSYSLHQPGTKISEVPQPFWNRDLECTGAEFNTHTQTHTHRHTDTDTRSTPLQADRCTLTLTICIWGYRHLHAHTYTLTAYIRLHIHTHTNTQKWCEGTVQMVSPWSVCRGDSAPCCGPNSTPRKPYLDPI